MTEKILKRSDGSFISYEYIPNDQNLTVVYLPGFRSSKQNTKALWLRELAAQKEIGFLSLDYTAHGNSSGEPIDFRVGQCLTDALDVIHHTTQTPLILVGSSFGGWIAFLLAERLKQRVCGVVGMAPAVDFMQDIWTHRMNDEIRDALKSGQIIGPLPETNDAPWRYEMFQEAEQYLLLSKGIDYNGPVCLIHGDSDQTIPYQKSFQIKDALTTSDVVIHILKGYGHSLVDDTCRYLLTAELKRLLKEIK